MAVCIIERKFEGFRANSSCMAVRPSARSTLRTTRQNSASEHGQMFDFGSGRGTEYVNPAGHGKPVSSGNTDIRGRVGQAVVFPHIANPVDELALQIKMASACDPPETSRRPTPMPTGPPRVGCPQRRKFSQYCIDYAKTGMMEAWESSLRDPCLVPRRLRPRSSQDSAHYGTAGSAGRWEIRWPQPRRKPIENLLLSRTNCAGVPAPRGPKALARREPVES